MPYAQISYNCYQKRKWSFRSRLDRKVCNTTSSGIA